MQFFMPRLSKDGTDNWTMSSHHICSDSLQQSVFALALFLERLARGEVWTVRNGGGVSGCNKRMPPEIEL